MCAAVHSPVFLCGSRLRREAHLESNKNPRRQHSNEVAKLEDHAKKPFTIMKPKAGLRS